MSNRFEQLRHRKFFSWVLAYLAAAWIVLQVADVLGSRWDWSQAFQRAIDILLIAGAFVTVILAWFHGEKGQQKISTIETGLLGGVALIAGVALLTVGERKNTVDNATLPDQGLPSFPMSSIAILPCTNRTGDDTLSYFVEGIHAELIDELANLSGLDVRARRSVMRFAEADVPLQQVAAGLKVGSAMACEVFRVGESVRIRTELLSLSPEDLLWSNAYDRGTENVVALYRDVARQVAEEISVAISPTERRRLDETSTVNPNAYQLYLSGRYLYGLGTRTGRDGAVGNLTASILLDPDYAPAWAALAMAYIDYHDHHAKLGANVKKIISSAIPRHAEIIAAPLERSRRPLLAILAQDAGEHAVDLDPSAANSWLALGWMHLVMTFDFIASMDAFDSALALQPSNARARGLKALLLRSQGLWVESLAEYQRAALDDPLSARIQAEVAIAQFYAGNPEKAFQDIEVVIDGNPDQPDNMWHFANILARFGHHTWSNEVLQRQIPLMGDDNFADELALMGYNYGRLGQHDAARNVVAELEAMEQEGQFVSPIIKSFPLIGIGDYDAAFAWLDRALKERDPWLSLLHLWPAFEPLRNDARFLAIVDQVGLPRVTPPCFDCDQI